MKKYILGLVLYIYSFAANATNYYVSNTGSDANNGTSTATPWQTLSRVKTAGNNGTILAGDNIYFKKGDNFIGGMYWSTLFGNTAVSGTAGNPITFSSYGTGAKPIFQVTPNANLGVSMLSFVGVNYITIDGFNITDLSFPLGDKVNKAYCGNGLELGSYNQIKSNNCIVKNCTFSNIGAPVVIIGNFNTVDSCSMTDLKNIVNTLGTAGQPNTFIDDYGANGITITGNDNTVTHSYFSGNWASSYDFGYNGGAFEMFDSCSRNKFLYNTITDCGGVAEFGAAVVNAIATDNLYAYNKIINCGLINWCNLTGSYTTNVNNTQYFNNVIIENILSRFSGPNNGAGVTTNPPATLQSFSYNGAPSTTVYNLKNNIFQLSSGINVLSTYAVPKTTHANNIYKLSNGGVTNFTPGASEVITSAILFANTTNTDATIWDFNMIAGSPGIGFGQSVSLTPDFAGVAVATPPNAGVYDTRPATSSVRTRILMYFDPNTGRAGKPLLDTEREVISSLMYDSLKHLYVDTSIRRNGYLLAFDSVNHKWYLAPGTASTGGTVTNIATGLGLLGGPITTTGTILVDTSSASILSRQRAAATYQPSLNLTTTGTGASTLVGSTLNIPVPAGTTYTGNAPVIVAGSVISADTTTRYTGLATIGKAVGDSNVLRAIINTNTANILSKLNISDTAAMLSPYLRTNIATSTYQQKISLTTTGTSGAATLVSNTLNIPQNINSPTALTDAATVTWDIDVKGLNTAVTLTGNRTLAISNSVAGTFGTLVVTQDGTGSRTLALPANAKVIGGGAGAITLTTTANAKDILTWYYDGTNYYFNYGKNYN